MMVRRQVIIGLIALCAPALALAQLPSRYIAGEHYSELPKPAATDTGEQTQVLEFFLYTCPHCRDFEPEVADWAAAHSEGVAFRRVPATFGSAGPHYARVFYTAQFLGVLQKLHDKIFDAIHEQDRPLRQVAAVREFFVANGVDGAEFDKAFESTAVSERVAAAQTALRAHRVTSVPSMGVAGRYWVSVRQAGGTQSMLNVVDYLIGRASDR